jgi:transcriptional regulator of acetoin/glycerol metabolism
VKSSDAKVESSNFRKKRKKRANNAGRPNCLDREAHENLLRAYYSHPYSFRELADMFGVSRMTVWRAVQDVDRVASGIS